MRLTTDGPLPSARAALSLVELLTVVGSLAVLVALLAPGVQQTRATAARLDCLNRMRQLGLALHQYHDIKGHFPPRPVSETSPDADSPTGLSWLGLILPYVDQEGAWEQALGAFQADTAAYHNPPHLGMATVVRTFVCPSDSRLLEPLTGPDGYTAAYTSYVGVSGGAPGAADGVLTMQGGVRISDITDGTSQTLMVGERPPCNPLFTGWWYTAHPAPVTGNDYLLNAEQSFSPDTPPNCVMTAKPDEYGTLVLAFRYGPGNLQNPCDNFHFWSRHPDGANFIFADGAVHFLPYSAEPVLRALATRNGNEAFELPF
jgi:prepilin-type processing-associated H-X9-DG protein